MRGSSRLAESELGSGGSGAKASQRLQTDTKFYNKRVGAKLLTCDTFHVN